MNGVVAPRLFTIAPGAAFLPTLAEALVAGRLVPGFQDDGDPLKLATATIYVPTRRAARELRAIFVERSAGGSAILPTVRPLGEFDEDEAAFGEDGAGALDLAPPIAAIDRLLWLAPLVQLWKSRLPAEVAARFEEQVTVPASTADAIWLARDLAALMDEIETEGSQWSGLAGLAPENLSGWWQVTLDFLAIVTRHWPDFLAERGWSNPAAHRNALIRLEAERLRSNPPEGPVIAAGSTGSIPATAELLATIARLPGGAVVLPGLDREMDDTSWSVLTKAAPKPAVLGHPQYGLAKLLGRMGVSRADVEEIGAPDEAARLRDRLVSEALRPADTTDGWALSRPAFAAADVDAALDGVTLVEAARERDEAVAIAIALRQAVEGSGGKAALVTGDRALARRVSAELLRFGVRADDSGGAPLMNTPPAVLLRLLVETALRPGDPVPVVALLKHPLLTLGMDRADVRRAAETIELVALRGGTGRPDIATLDALFEERLTGIAGQHRQPFWFPRLDRTRIEAASGMLGRLVAAVRPLAGIRSLETVAIADAVRASVLAFEALGRDEKGSLAELYKGDAGEKLAEFLRGLIAASATVAFAPGEWPDVLHALIGPEVVKPAAGADRRISIWGALEARLQSVDTLVIGGLNEGSWPRRAEADRFMSRPMKSGLDLEPPERRIGQAAHDFVMAMGTQTRHPDPLGAIGRGPRRRLALAAEVHDLCRQAGHGSDARAWRGPAGLGLAHRRRPARRLCAPARAETSAGCPAEGFLGHRNRDVAPRSLRGLRAAGVEPVGARPAAARSRRGGARHAVPRDHASLRGFGRRSRRPGSAWHPARQGPRVFCRSGVARRCRGRLVAAFPHAGRRDHHLGKLACRSTGASPRRGLRRPRLAHRA